MIDAPRVSRPRVVVIGLDGATFQVLEPLIAAGEMPALARLMAQGTHGVLQSTFPPLTPPAWTSLATGKNPGAHGVFAFRQPAAAGYESGGLVNSGVVRARTLWEIAGEAGVRVGVVNVPPSYPLRPLNGFQVACMFTPPGERQLVHPPELAPILGDDYVPDVKPPSPLRSSDPDYGERARGYLAALEAQARRRTSVTLGLMAASPCDLLVTVVYEPDRVQHFFWDFLVGTPPADVPAVLRDELRSAVRAVFRAVDDGIEALVAAGGPEAVVLLASDHGCGPAPERLVRVNRWLAEHGFLTLHRAWRWRRRLARQLSGTLRERFKRVDRVLVDFRRTAAWCEVLDTHSAGIWLNLRGRQPEGWIEPGADYERRRRDLCERLAALRDGDARVFEMVAPREDVYRGAATERAPDILLQSARSHGLWFGLWPEFTGRSWFARYDVNGYRGTHDPEGIYVAAGRGVAAGGAAEPARIESIAPTVLALLELPIPDGMEASPLLHVLTPAARAATPIRFVPDAARDAAGTDGWESAEDQAGVAEQLRALGYLE